MSKETEVEEPQSMISGSADNEPDPAIDREAPSSDIKPPDSSSPAGTKKNSFILASKATGPRTKLGKERSSRNALKHGIFSRAAILQEDEQWVQFDSLLQGLRKDLQPVGMLENMLVDKLASLMWRYRRMLVAERAEIRLGKFINPLTAEREKQQREEALLFCSVEKPDPGLISRLENPLIRDRMVELLKSLQLRIQVNGFDPEYDRWILRVVYGQKIINGPLITYGLCSKPVKEKELKELNLTAGELKAFEEFDLPPAELKAKFIQCLKEYIDGIRRYGECMKFVPAQRVKLERGCTGVPEGPRLDRLLRYEASLDRSFDRTLSQLERLQRMRLGQPVLPKLEVRHSLS